MRILDFVSSFTQKVVNDLSALNDYLESNMANKTALSSECGSMNITRVDIDRIVRLHIQTSNNIETESRHILSLLQQSMSLLECRNIYSMYSRISTEAICRHFVRGAFGAWLTLILLVIIAILILVVWVWQHGYYTYLPINI